MIGGALSGYLDQYMMPPEGDSGLDIDPSDVQLEWDSPNEDRLNEYLGNTLLHPMAAYSQGLGRAKRTGTDFIFTDGGRVNLTETQLHAIRRQQDALGQTNGMPASNKDIASASYFTEYMVTYLSDNYRKRMRLTIIY